MGHQMISVKAHRAAALLVSTLLVAQPAAATGREDQAARHAVGIDIDFSSDADDTQVFKLGGNADWNYESPEKRQGIRVERVRYNLPDQSSTTDYRICMRMADRIAAWKWSASVGTDGDTVLGTASIHNEAPLRQEYFLEREKVETAQGVSRGLYSTYGGGALDVPLSRTAQATLLSGLQLFTGKNVRTHLRANFIQVVKPDWGLSVQLRGRYFHDSRPGEYDYFSPRWFVEVLPVVQVRRYHKKWRYLAAAGLGGQRNAGADWRQSRFLNLRVTSPADRNGWSVAGDFTHSSNPVTNNSGYRYSRLSIGLTRAF